MFFVSFSYRKRWQRRYATKLKPHGQRSLHYDVIWALWELIGFKTTQQHSEQRTISNKVLWVVLWQNWEGPLSNHASSDCGTAPSQRFSLRIIMAFHAISIGLGVGLWYYISCSYAFSFLLCMYLFDHFYIQCWLLFCWMKVCFSTWCQCFYSLNIKMQLKEIISVFADVLVYCTAPQQYSKHWVMILFSRESQHCFTEVTWIIRLFLRFGLPHRLS